MTRFATILVTLAVFAVTAGCSDLTGPSIPEVTGQWTYNATNLQSSGVTCGITGVTLSVTHQSGENFSGSTSGGTLNCSDGQQSISEPLANLTIVSGVVRENGSISFNLQSQDWTNTGSLAGASMSGSTSLRAGDFTLTGSFSASRQ
jgi:hypothetical protein